MTYSSPGPGISERGRWHAALLISFVAILVWSGYAPVDRFVWILEVLPAIIGAAVLIAIYPRTKLTMLVYCLIWLHALILMLGGHWTYAEMPVFNWLRDEYGLARNYYDRVGHVFQGAVPAMIAREIFIRARVVNGRGWRYFLVCCVALAISAFYEFIEWWVAIASGQAADAFLATQGDIWDTQWDMFMALSGALVAQLLFGRWHDRQLAALGAPVPVRQESASAGSSSG
jgi:putative membrane protein